MFLSLKYVDLQEKASFQVIFAYLYGSCERLRFLRVKNYTPFILKSRSGLYRYLVGPVVGDKIRAQSYKPKVLARLATNSTLFATPYKIMSDLDLTNHAHVVPTSIRGVCTDACTCTCTYITLFSTSLH